MAIQNRSSERVFADLALGFTSLVWGATFVVVKNGLSDASVLVFLAVRFSLAAFVLALLFGGALRRLHLRQVWAGVQIGLFLFGGYVFQTAGLRFTTPSKAAFITGSSVALVPILLGIFGRRSLTGWIWLGACAALVGLFLVTVSSNGFSGLNQGDVLVLGCAVMFALHIIWVGRYADVYPVALLAFLQIATTAVLALVSLPIFSLIGWERPHIAVSGNLVSAILITAIGSTVIGFSLQVWAQRITPSSRAAILLSLESVFAAITSWLVQGEHLGGHVIFGGAMILVGILVAELSSTGTLQDEPAEVAHPRAE